MFSTLTVLGSTGSIGRQTLAVARRFPDRFRVVGLSAGRNAALLVDQVREFRPQFVHVADPAALREAEDAMHGEPIVWLTGDDGLRAIAAEAPADLVLVATVGFKGMMPTMAALAAGRHIALANKEVLVCGGETVMALARERERLMLPVDSEHNAIFQCLQAAGPRGAQLRRLILTCSGGSFRNADDATIATATAAQTLKHPTWTMGAKITVDSATLMNKGFEVIEAHHLFAVDARRIEVTIHPQSIVHSMVEFTDGSMIAQLGVTDMRLPIQNVLTYPERLETDLAPLDLAKMARLDFSAPDVRRFPCLRMAYESLEAGGGAPCVLNAANEIAVEAHLEDRIPCGAIARVIEATLERLAGARAETVHELQALDGEARRVAAALLPEAKKPTHATEAVP